MRKPVLEFRPLDASTGRDQTFAVIHTRAKKYLGLIAFWSGTRWAFIPRSSITPMAAVSLREIADFLEAKNAK